MKLQYILPLVLIGLAVGGGGGVVYGTFGDHSTVSDSAVPTVHRGASHSASTGDSVTTTEAVPEFSGISALVMGLAVTSIIGVATVAGVKLRHKL